MPKGVTQGLVHFAQRIICMAERLKTKADATVVSVGHIVNYLQVVMRVVLEH